MSESSFDKRIVERKIKRGVVDQKNYDKFMGELDDCSDVADEIQTNSFERLNRKNKSKKKITFNILLRYHEKCCQICCQFSFLVYLVICTCGALTHRL